MKWMIIVLVMLSLIGSMMWVMPSKRQRFQAKLRTQAKQMGFTVQLVRLTAPRAKGEGEGNEYTTMAYRLPRLNNKGKKADTVPWHVFRVDALANEGLPAGWSWLYGERALSAPQLACLADVMAALPAGVSSIESTPLQVSAHWDEWGEVDSLSEIKQHLQVIIDAGF